MLSSRSFAGAAFATALLAVPGATWAQGHRQHGSHEHGVAILRLAREGGEVHLELTSPAANIVGFERAPASATEQAALEAAIAALRQGERLFRFPGEAGCRLTEVEVHTPLLVADDAGHRDGHGHAEHGHGHGHEHAEHGRAEHGRAEHEHAEHEHGSEEARDTAAHLGEDRDTDHADRHADIEASYRFDCASPAAMRRLELGLFDAFPATERVRAQYVLPSGQGAGVVTADAPILGF